MRSLGPNGMDVWVDEVRDGFGLVEVEGYARHIPGSGGRVVSFCCVGGDGAGAGVEEDVNETGTKAKAGGDAKSKESTTGAATSSFTLHGPPQTGHVFKNSLSSSAEDDSLLKENLDEPEFSFC